GSGMGRLPGVLPSGGRPALERHAADVHGRRREERAPRPHLPRLPAQPARLDLDRRVLHPCAPGRAGLDAADVGGAGTAHPLRPLHRDESLEAPHLVEGRPVGGLREDPAEAAGAAAMTTAAPRRIFVLSPASCGGERARLLFDPRARFELARALRATPGVPLGVVFSFLSGLYFRGKLEYARTYARPPAGMPGRCL